MKSLLFLSLIGAAIYAVLLIANPLPDSNSDAVAVHAQGQGTAPAAGQRSSWASDLSTLKPQIAAQDRPHLRYYERKPRQKLPTMDEEAVADSTEAKPVAAAPKPKVASRKAKSRVESAQAELSDRVAVRKSDFKRPRWQRRAERRARKAFGSRAFLLGR